MSALTFGKFVVRIGLRRDNPAFPVYIVYANGKEIGRSFSVPDRGCCEWLARQRANAIRYAEPSAPQHRHSRSIAKARAFSLTARK